MPEDLCLYLAFVTLVFSLRLEPVARVVDVLDTVQLDSAARVALCRVVRSYALPAQFSTHHSGGLRACADSIPARRPPWFLKLLLYYFPASHGIRGAFSKIAPTSPRSQASCILLICKAAASIRSRLCLTSGSALTMLGFNRFITRR